MNSRESSAIQLVAVLSSDPGLALDLYEGACELVCRIERLRARLLIGPPPHDTCVLVARLRDDLDLVERRLRESLTVIRLMDVSEAIQEADATLEDKLTDDSELLSAFTLHEHLALDLPPRTRSDDGPIFDALELAPLSPPDPLGVVVSLTSTDELDGVHREQPRWGLFAHIAGSGCEWICDFESADLALDALRRLLGDLREWPIDRE